jgi:hypothetical protein
MRSVLGYGEQRLLLVLHISLDGFDQIGDFVVTLLEQHVNIGPGAIVLVAQPHQPVVQDDGVDEHTRYKQEKGQPRDCAAAHRYLSRDC